MVGGCHDAPPSHAGTRAVRRGGRGSQIRRLSPASAPRLSRQLIRPRPLWVWAAAGGQGSPVSPEAERTPELIGPGRGGGGGP